MDANARHPPLCRATQDNLFSRNNSVTSVSPQHAGIQSAHSRKVHWSSAIQLELEHDLRKQQPPLASFSPSDLKIRAKRFQICAAPADRRDGPAPPLSSAYGCYYLLYKHHHHVWIIQENIYRWVQGRLRICAKMTSSFKFWKKLSSFPPNSMTTSVT